MIKTIREYLKTFYILSFILIFIAPKGSAIFFDGLPWSSKEEIILFVIFFPFLFFLKSDHLKKKSLIYFILVLNIISVLLFFSSKIGVSHKQFFSMEDVEKDNKIKTYDSIWFKDFSAIQKKNWKKKTNFPLDWSGRHPLNFNKENNSKYFNDYDEFAELKLFYKSNFYLVVNEKNNIQININGLNQNESSIEYKDIINDSNTISIDSKKNFFLDKGIYKFEINAAMEGRNWSYEVFFIENDKFISAIKNKKIFYEINSKNIDLITFYNLIGSMFDYLVISLIIILLFFIIKKHKLINYIIGFTIIFFITNFIFLKINSLIKFDLTGIFAIAFFLIVILKIYLFKKFIIQNDNQKLNIDNLFFLISIFIIMFFSWVNYGNLENISWYSIGDDWEIFQVLGRLIAVDNIWVYQEEGVTIRRYGIRLLVALLHVVFGKSFFPQQIFEIWSIILSAYLLTRILIISKIHKDLAISFGFLLLIIFFGENFRWLVGRGLTEFYSLFLVMMTAYLFTKNNHLKNKSFSKIILPCFLGFLIIVFREDHITFVCGLVFFGIFNNSRANLIYSLIQSVKENLKSISLYYLFLIFGLVFILTKNFISFDTLGVSQDAFHFKFELLKKMLFDSYVIKQSSLIGTDIENVYSTIEKRHYLEGIYRFFTASDPYDFPRPTLIILVSGFLFSVYCLFFFKVHSNLNLGIVLLPILCVINPLIFLTQAYNPRYIICYLPFALMSVCVLINIFNNKFSLLNYFDKK